MSAWPTILTYAGLGALILAFGWIGMIIARRSGRAEAERDQAVQSADRAKVRHEIDEDVARLSDSALDDELRSPR